MYSKSPRENSKYKYNRDIAAMSDPGVARLEQNHRQHRSHIEYARSEIASPSSSYYEPQQRAHKPASYLQEGSRRETRPQFSQNRYSSAPLRRKSLSPPLEQQRREAHSLLQQIYSRDGEMTGRDNFAPANVGYGGSMYKSSPSYSRRSLDSSSSASAVNVKELKRQLWNNNEVLKVQDPSPPRYNRRNQQSLSPQRQPQRHGSSPPSNNLPRFARSLSPRRRQYQQSSPMVDESPSQIRKVNSTMSDTSYNSRFHSKFFEAALVAQKRGDENNKVIEDNGVEDSQKHHIEQYQQHQVPGGNEYPPTSSYTHHASNPNSSGKSRKIAAQYHRGNYSYVNMSNGRGSEGRRPPIMSQSPSSSSSSPVMNNERFEGQHQRHYGRSKDSPQFRRSDGSARRIRPPSPLLLDRIRSFDHDYYDDHAFGVSEGQDQRYKRVADHQSDSWRDVNYNDNTNNNNGQEVNGGKKTRSHSIVNNENKRRQHQGRFHSEGNNYDSRKGHASELNVTGVIRENVHGGSHLKHQGMQIEGPHDFSTEIRKNRMAHLVGKLSAVNRANPKDALAQIDSILREESRSSHTHRFENPIDGDDTKDVKLQSHNNYPTESNFTERENEDEGDDVNDDVNDDDDESSDVSSITNPTFQQGTRRSNYNSLYIRENDHYIMHKTTQDSNLGSFNPSTSSFRRPRPSHLQNYSNDVSKDLNSMSRSDWKRQQLEKFPPPSTIKVKDGQAKNESPRQNSADLREMMLQKNMKKEASHTKKTNKVSRELEKSGITKNNSKKKLDNSIADKQGLAEKIRGWDEMSHQLSKSRSEQEENIEVRQNLEAFSKPHPWDSNTNVVQTKDTSMENAIGIEAEISERAHHYGSYTHERDPGAEISVEGSKVPTNIEGNHFEKARRNIKDRSGHNPFNDPSVDSNENHTLAKAQFLDIRDQGDPIPNIEVSMKGIPQFNPSHQKQVVPGGRDRDEKKSDDKVSRWVEMPPSSYFPDINDNYEPISSKVSRNSGISSKPLGTSGGQLNLQGGQGLSDSRSMARLACKTILPKEPKVKEKKRGFLNAFMGKKKINARSVGYTASASAGSISGHSTSIESRGVKSASHIQSSSRPNTAESPKTNFHILAPPPGVFQTGTNTRGRPGHRSASAPRHRSNRSKSSEKFRSNSMAQKFNRVMQLYDSDEI